MIHFARLKSVLAGSLLLSALSCAATDMVRVQTELGEFVVEIETEKAPITAKNFLRYVDAGAFDGGTFHRAVRLDNQNRDDILIEVIQGRPARGAESYGSIPLERTNETGLKHLDGTISMARGGPDSASSGIFICINDQPSLDFGAMRNADGQGVAAFGRVVEGMDVVRAIQQSPTERENLTPAIQITSAARVR